MFPELKERFSKFAKRFDSTPVALNLKGAYGYFGLDDNIIAQAYRRDGFYGIANALGGGHQPPWSGELVNIHTSQNLSAVWACKRVITETVGALPCEMMQRTAKDERREATDKPLYAALKMAPNEEMSAMSYFDSSMGHAVMHGTSYSTIVRRSGTGVAIGLYPIQPHRIHRDRDQRGKLVWVVDQDRSYTVEAGKPHDILSIPGLSDDGIQGISVLHVARQSMGTALAAERNVGSFYARGGRLPYNMKQSALFDNEESAKKWRFDWEMTYNDPHRVPVVIPSMEYQQIGLSLKDQQMLESRQWGTTEICRWFGVQPHMIFDLARSTNNNIEQQALEFLKFTLTPWITRLEQNLWRCVLTPEEKTQGFYFKHNYNALLRGEFATRMAGYATMLQNGVSSIDDVLGLEDQNPLPNGAGQARHIQVNMQTLPGTGEPLQPSQPSESPNAKPINQPRAS